MSERCQILLSLRPSPALAAPRLSVGARAGRAEEPGLTSEEAEEVIDRELRGRVAAAQSGALAMGHLMTEYRTMLRGAVLVSFDVSLRGAKEELYRHVEEGSPAPTCPLTHTHSLMHAMKMRWRASTRRLPLPLLLSALQRRRRAASCSGRWTSHQQP